MRRFDQANFGKDRILKATVNEIHVSLWMANMYENMARCIKVFCIFIVFALAL